MFLLPIFSHPPSWWEAIYVVLIKNTQWCESKPELLRRKAAALLIMLGAHLGNTHCLTEVIANKRGSVWECIDTQEYLHLPDVTAYVTCTQWTPTEQRIISIQNHHFLPDMKVSFIKDVQKSIIYRNNIYFTCLLCIFPASISI